MNNPEERSCSNCLNDNENCVGSDVYPCKGCAIIDDDKIVKDLVNWQPKCADVPSIEIADRMGDIESFKDYKEDTPTQGTADVDTQIDIAISKYGIDFEYAKQDILVKSSTLLEFRIDVKEKLEKLYARKFAEQIRADVRGVLKKYKTLCAEDLLSDIEQILNEVEKGSK